MAVTSTSSSSAAPRRGRPPRTDEQRAEQRARLLTAAMDCIRDFGPEVSIDDMAAVAGVSKPVLFYEFGDKSGIADGIALILAERLERHVLDVLARAGGFDIDIAIDAVVKAIVDLVDAEPALYAYLVRSFRTGDRGFLDNALVRVIQERAQLLVGLVAPGLEPNQQRVLTDGLFGFVFAAVESWHPTKRPNKGELVRTLSAVIRVGFRAVGEQAATQYG